MAFALCSITTGFGQFNNKNPDTDLAANQEWNPSQADSFRFLIKNGFHKKALSLFAQRTAKIPVSYTYFILLLESEREEELDSLIKVHSVGASLVDSFCLHFYQDVVQEQEGTLKEEVKFLSGDVRETGSIILSNEQWEFILTALQKASDQILYEDYQRLHQKYLSENELTRLDTLWSMMKQFEFLFLAGDNELAEKQLNQIRSFAVHESDSFWVNVVDYHYGLLFDERRASNKVLALHRKAEQYCRTNSCPVDMVTNLHVYLGIHYKRLGQELLALKHKQYAVDWIESNGDTSSVNYAVVLNSMAIAYNNLGQYDQSISYYAKARDIVLKLYGAEHYFVATLDANIAKLYNELGDTKLALFNAKHALQIFQEQGSLFDEVWIRNIIAEALLYMDSFAEAKSELLQCLQIYESEEGLDPFYLPIIYNTLGEVEHSMGDTDNALLYLRKSAALTTQQKGQFNLDYCNVINNQIKVNIRLKKFDQVDSLLHHSQSIFDSLPKQNILRSYFLVNRIYADLYHGRLLGASKGVKEFLSAFEFEITQIVPYLSERQHLKLLDRKLNQLRKVISLVDEYPQVQPLIAMKDLYQAHATLKSIAFRVKKKLKDKSGSLTNEQLFEFDLLRQQIISSLRSGADNRLVDSLKKRAEDLERIVNIKTSSEDLILRPSKLLSTLDSGEVLLDFCLYEDKYTGKFSGFVFKCKNNSISLQRLYHADSLSTDLIENYLSQLFHKLDSSELQNVFIVPEGKLHITSFEAIVLEGEDRFAIDRFKIIHLTSISELKYQSNPPQALESIFAIGGLFYENPGLKKNEGSFSYLAGTEKEIQLLSELYPHANILRGCAADYSSVMERLRSRSFNLVHIATHGLLSDDYSTYKHYDKGLVRSSLVLSHCQHEQTPYLRAIDLSIIDFSKTELVFLSACNSGLGQEAYGDFLFGFQRVILSSGAKNIIYTIREVPDIATYLFTKNFYSEWGNGATIYQAFQKALLQLRKTYPPEIWGAFKLMGTKRPNAAQKRTPNILQHYWWIIVAFCSILFATLLFVIRPFFRTNH